MPYIEVDGLHVPIEPTAFETDTSKRTGRDLEVISAAAALRDDHAHQRLLEVVGSKTPVQLGEAQREGKRWAVTIPRWSHRSDSPVYQYSLRLEEYEDYQVDVLHFGDLSLRTITYEDKVSDTGLTIHAVGQLEQAADTFQDLWWRGGYFPVRREGIEEPAGARTMRFGLCFWSAAEDTRKYKVVLVDQSVDEAEGRFGGFVHLDTPAQTSRYYLAYLQGMVKGLTDLLVDKGLAIPEDIEAIDTIAREDGPRRVWDFYRVDDAEDFM